MSVKTSVRSPAQSLSTEPGMLSGLGALGAFIPLNVLLWGQPPGHQEGEGTYDQACCDPQTVKNWFSSFNRVMGCPPGELLLSLPDAAGQVGPSPKVCLVFCSKGNNSGLLESVDLPCQPWLLVVPASDGLEVCHIMVM